MAATKIQGLVRPLMAKKRAEAAKIQCLVRALMARKEARRLTLEKQARAATGVQTAWRRTYQRARFLSCKTSTIRIQSSARIVLAKKEAMEVSHLNRTRAATRIQTTWRCLDCRSKFTAQRQSCVRIQSWIRRVQAEWEFDLQMGSVTCIQDCFRAYMVRSRLNSAAAQLQGWWRSLKEEERVQASSTRIQANYRAYRLRCQLLQQFDAAYTIQRWYKRVHAANRRVEFLQALAHERASTSCRRQDTLLSDCSVSIHGFGYVDVTREYQLCSILTFPADKTELSATLIATAFRTYAGKKSYAKAVAAAVAIQRKWRLCSGLKRKVFTRAIVNDEGIEVEQVQQTTWVKRLRTIAAILVQSWYRANRQRINYAMLKKQLTDKSTESPTTLVRAKSPIHYLAPGSSSFDASGLTTSASGSVALLSPIWLFRPEAVLSMPLSLASCLDAGLAVNAVGSTEMVQSSKSTFQEEENVAIKYRRSTEDIPEKDGSPTSITSLSNTITRSQALAQLRLIVSAACRLQAWSRGRLVRLQEIRVAMASKVAAVFRGSRSRLFVRRIRCAVMIQRQVRAQGYAVEFQKLRRGFLALQNYWAMYARRPEFVARIAKRNNGIAAFQKRVKRQHRIKAECAVKIQRQWKLWRGVIKLQRVAKMRFHVKTTAVLRLQRWWRMTSARFLYGLQKAMAIRLQSKWRCFAMRSAFFVQYDGFSCLQRVARSCFAKKTFAVLFFQRQTRMKIMMNAYHQKQAASGLLQKTCRRHLCYVSYRKMYIGFLQIQQREKQRFRLKTQASVLIQRFWRMETQRSKFDKLFIGIISLQKLAIEAFARKTGAATLIQAQWRCRTKYCVLRGKKEASIKIQKQQRRFASRTKALVMRRGFLTLQSIGRERFQRKTTSVLLLQRFWRMVSASMEYTTILGATIVLQTRWRSYFCRARWFTICHGFTGLQVLAHQAYIRKTGAATLIQCSSRRYVAATAYERSRRSLIALQSHWRRHADQRQYAVQLWGFKKLQQLGKAIYLLKMRSAVAIETNWRRFIARRNFFTAQAAAIAIQSQMRGKLQRSAYRNMIPGFVSLQVLAKLWFRIKNTCAVKIQTATRRMAAQKRYQFQQGAAVTIQCAFRGFVQRRNLAVFRWLNSIAATMLTSWWRRITCESRYQQLRFAVHVLQFRTRRRRRDLASVKLQSWWRCLTQRRTYLKELAAIKIQAWYRCAKQRKAYIRELATIRIQAWCRCSKQRKAFIRELAAIWIQAWHRCSKQRKAYLRELAAIKLQARWRCLSQRRAYVRELAAIKLQSWCRCKLQTQQYQLQKRSSIKLKTLVRYFLALCRERQVAARRIQQCWADSQRRFVLRCSIAALRRVKAAKVVQRRWREVVSKRRRDALLKEVEEEAKRALEDTSTSALRVPHDFLLSRSVSSASYQSHHHQSKTQSFSASAVFCNFDLSIKALTLPWATLTNTRPARTEPLRVCGRSGSARRRKDTKKLSTVRVHARRIRSAILIQREWRKFQSKLTKERYYKSIAAAWIQCIWRGYAARILVTGLRRNKAAFRIQRAWRRACIRRIEAYQCLRIQSVWRMALGQRRYDDLLTSHRVACSIQRLWRMHYARKRFVRMHSGVLKIQALTRKNIGRDRAARKIQSAWWMHMCRRRRDVFDEELERKDSNGSSLPAMVLQAGLAWVLSDPRVIEFALNGGV